MHLVKADTDKQSFIMLQMMDNLLHNPIMSCFDEHRPISVWLEGKNLLIKHFHHSWWKFTAIRPSCVRDTYAYVVGNIHRIH